MGKSLVITEKPSVAKEIANVLQVNTENRGGYYEDDRYVISWAAGHLLSLGYPGDQNPAWEEYRMDTLPMFTELKVFPIPSAARQLKILVDLIGRMDVDEIINAGDAGIEGEGIQWEIYNYAFARTGKRKRVRRLWISSVSPKAIREGFDNLEPEGSRENLYAAFLARRNGDWFYGMNTSRFFGMTYNVTGLSSGSVKNQILGMVVKRCRDIQNFKPEPFYQVTAHINESFAAGWQEEAGDRIHQRGDAEEIVRKVSGQKGTVTLYEKKERSQKPPVLYNLAKLQSEAVKQYGITSDRTLEILQSLYLEHKIITYPRTDSEYITSNDTQDIRKLVEMIAASAYVKNMDSSISQAAKQVLKTGILVEQIVNDKKVNDHPGLLINENFAGFDGTLTDDEKKILCMVLKRLLVSISEPYLFSETVIQLECNGETFGCTGKTPVYQGYKAVEALWKNKDEASLEKEGGEKLLPLLEQGDDVRITEAVVLDKMTAPPHLFNESSLFAAMENIASLVEDKKYKKVLKDKRGIGTSATRAAIFKELLDKKYLYKDDSKNKKLPHILPTDLGEKLYDILPPDMTTPELAAKWQDMLNQIEQGTITYEHYIKEMQDFITDKIKNYKKVEETGLETKRSDRPTQKQMDLAESISLTLNIPLPYERTISVISDYITNHMTAYIEAPEKKYAKQADYVIGKCPLCGGNVNLAKSGMNYYCANYKQGCRFSVMKSDFVFKHITGRDITKAVLRSLLEKGSAKCGGKTVMVKWNTGTSPKGFMMHTFTGK